MYVSDGSSYTSSVFKLVISIIILDINKNICEIIFSKSNSITFHFYYPYLFNKA